MTLDLPVDIEEDDKKIIKTTFKPLGVCGGICPWNCKLWARRGVTFPVVWADEIDQILYYWVCGSASPRLLF